MHRPRVRHHTDDASLDGIKAAGTIAPSRGWGSVAIGVHVEVEPFGTTRPFRPGQSSPKADLGLLEDGAFVEFDAPPGMVPSPHLGPRNSAIIPTPVNQPFSLAGLNPVFVKVRRHWWEFWRTKAE
jgi:hypothetical protein